MLSRLLPKPSHFRRLTLLSSTSYTYPHPNLSFSPLPKFFSNSGNSNDGKFDPSTSTPWNLPHESDGKFDQFFTQDSGNLAGIPPSPEDDQSWLRGSEEKTSGEENWATAELFKPGRLVEEETMNDLFSLEKEAVREFGDTGVESRSSVDGAQKSREDAARLEREERELSAILKGPNRAFGDLIAASGITDEMLDSLIALKDFEGIEGLPPLSEIEEMRYEKNTKKITRAEIERQKQEEVAKARVRQVDEKGRAYGTGRRKCSIARVWIQPGDGKFVVNDKQFDVYFPMLDHRAALLRPFSETKTLGLWDVDCTVKGGGVSGQVGAVRLGVSRALQNWEPDLRPPLRAAGFLTRDPRVVERKKPGKAKARKSFQWVKR
ncbi:30S ribosomal protein S9 [Morella rubra]|uniref:30S ribosomal protein S9 n=1 Tax=Morella rubra TaxID=262757 RepID=A0A6A1UWS5_9ROSI|nr:30S ribosomal protein S9 [Morella rubra]KAB1204875.1 30S ribosomal protein S9 [Morella rubra]